MAITATLVANSAVLRTDLVGTYRRRASLTIAGLTAGGANTIPHGLAYTPGRLSLRPGASGLWGETQAPDATNIYITVGGGGATGGTIDVEE